MAAILTTQCLTVRTVKWIKVFWNMVLILCLSLGRSWTLWRKAKANVQKFHLSNFILKQQGLVKKKSNLLATFLCQKWPSCMTSSLSRFCQKQPSCVTSIPACHAHCQNWPYCATRNVERLFCSYHDNSWHINIQVYLHKLKETISIHSPKQKNANQMPQTVINRC